MTARALAARASLLSRASYSGHVSGGSARASAVNALIRRRDRDLPFGRPLASCFSSIPPRHRAITPATIYVHQKSDKTSYSTFHSSTGTAFAAAVSASAFLVGSSVLVSCEFESSESQNDASYASNRTACKCESLPENDDDDDADDDDTLPPNPLWPSGVPQSMVDSFVDEMLADKNINIAAIPDSIERQIYVSTVQLTLNAVYETVGGFHGMEILGHRIELHRVDDEGNEIEKGQYCGSIDGVKNTAWESYTHSAYGKGSIDHAALESVANRLLANTAVNQPLVPDVIERALYVNCLKLVFHLLDAVACTLRMTLCGHDMSIHFEPCTDQSTREWIKDRLRKRASETSARLTEVDLDAVEAYAREVGAAPVDPKTSWLGQIVDSGQREMTVQLHKTLYALVLGILDDLLEDTVLTFLSDKIRLDVVAKKKITKANDGKASERVQKEEKEKKQLDASGTASRSAFSSTSKNQGSIAVPFTAFTFGVGIGAVVATYAGSKS